MRKTGCRLTAEEWVSLDSEYRLFPDFIGSPPARQGRRAGDRRRALVGPGHRAQRHLPRGTLFRHACGHEPEPSPIHTLVVTVVEPAERALLVASARRTLTSPARFGAALEPAVDLAAVAASADMEDDTAPPASGLPKAVVHGARMCANAGR